MGGLNGRITRLEQNHLGGTLGNQAKEDEAKRKRADEKRAEIRARLQRVIDSEAEGEEMDPRRQRAIEDFLESWRSRRRREGAS